MKAFALLCFMVAVSAEEFHMKLNENGEKFTEDIKIDVAGNTEEITVPQHQDRAAIVILNDFNTGFSATKMLKSRKCLISSIDKSEQKPLQMKQSMELAHSRFPTDQYMVKNSDSLLLRKMGEEEVGEKIAKHCSGYELILTAKVTKDNMEEIALNHVKSMMKGRRKRQALPNEVFTCNYDSINVLNTCPISKLAARCIAYPGLPIIVYQVACIPKHINGQVRTWCDGMHSFGNKHCCYFSCLPRHPSELKRYTS